MPLIGIACNPQSGKDIRRLLTAATTIDDMEKLNILERILLSAAAVGEQSVCLMPDRLGYGRLLLQKRNSRGYPGDLSQLEIYDMDRTETQADTIFFASEMERIGADVLIVMGGDGTSRAAAKGTRRVPMISMSTGTNNVYPELMEGTVAGMAAAALAGGMVPAAECASPAKCIEIWKNGTLVDLDDGVLIAMAKAGGAAPLMHLSTLTGEGGFSNELAHIALTDRTVQDALISNLRRTLEEKGYRGLDVDFEYVFPEDASAYAAFLGRLTALLNPLGYPVIAALAPKTSADQPGLLYEAHNYRAIAEAVNEVLLMTYEWGYTYHHTGPR